MTQIKQTYAYSEEFYSDLKEQKDIQQIMAIDENHLGVISDIEAKASSLEVTFDVVSVPTKGDSNDSKVFS